MRTYTVTHREGEHLGPVDWSYDFTGHAKNGGSEEWVNRGRDLLKQIEEGMERGEVWRATTDGGWPRVGWHRVVVVGMYDGWPYWRPVPSVLLAGPLGAEWHSFTSLTDAYRDTQDA